MTARTTLAALLLASTPLLAACGGSSDEPAGSGASGSASSSESASESPSGSAEAEAPTAADFDALFRALEKAQPSLESARDTEQLNAEADLPEGVEFGSYDRQQRQVCVQDRTTGAVVDFNAGGTLSLAMAQGTCDDYDDLAVAKPDPKDPDALAITGDREIGDTAQQFFERVVG